MAMNHAIRVDIASRFPVSIEADADAFGQVYASMSADEQVAVWRSMVEHMHPHRLQWDHVSIELETPENREVRDQLREVLFPSEAGRDVLAALQEARVQVAILQDRLGIVDPGTGTLSIIDAALAKAVA